MVWGGEGGEGGEGGGRAWRCAGFSITDLSRLPLHLNNPQSGINSRIHHGTAAADSDGWLRPLPPFAAPPRPHHQPLAAPPGPGTGSDTDTGEKHLLLTGREDAYDGSA